MKSVLKFSLLSAACAALLFAATSANAMRIAPPAPAIRAAQAHTIIVGKVESIEEKTVSAKQFPGAKDKVEYQIAVIKVTDPILAAKGLTHIRVGFIPPPAPPMGKPGGPIAIGPRRYDVTLAKDQEGLFFLQPHNDGNFMIIQGFDDAVFKQGNQNFDQVVTDTKKFIKLLDSPKESLKAEKQEDRFTAAAMLITKYRYRSNFGAAEPKTEAIDADISKLILTALGEADWKANGPGLFRMNPLQMFTQLGVTDKDDYNPPMMEVQVQGQPPRKQIDYAKLPDYAKQWCKDNAGKYKIQKFVYEEKKDK
jgi:hypothetical protein